MEKGALIGIGMTAEVYEWGTDKVLKLYFKRFSDDWARREAGIGMAVCEAGVSSPKVYETIEKDGRKGVIFQRISGKSIMEHIITEPYMLHSYAQRVARLHYRIHKCFSDNLPSQRERFEYTLGRSSKILGKRIDRILEYMEHLPDGNTVCHGDLHFDNIIISGNKLVPIDWSAAYRGSPLGDVARVCMIIISPSVPPFVPDFLAFLSGCIRQQICRAYLEEYMRLANVSLKDIDPWILPVAAAKLKDKVPGEEKWLMDIVNRRLDDYDKSNLPEVNCHEFQN